MSRLHDLIEELCPNGVIHDPLGKAGVFIRGNGLQKADFVHQGVPAIHYGQIHTTYGTWTAETVSFVAPELANRLRKAEPGDLVIATTSEDDEGVAKATAWLGHVEAAVSGDAYIYRHSLNPKYVAYVFQAASFQAQKQRWLTGAKVRRISGEGLAKIRIPVPPAQVQDEIVHVLDSFQSLQVALKAELAARRRQYTHYRQRVLTYPAGSGIEWSPIGPSLSMRAGQFIAAAEINSVQDAEHPYPCYGGNGIRGFVARSNHDGDYLLIGRQGALSGNVKRVSGKFYATEHAVATKVGPNLSVDWAFHMLTLMNLNQYVSKGAQPGLSVGTLQTVLMPVPDLREQERAAAILDSLDALVDDASMGLPAEIQARLTQFEYYRDKLLTFAEAPA